MSKALSLIGGAFIGYRAIPLLWAVDPLAAVVLVAILASWTLDRIAPAGETV
jgi:hypothetical protein